MRLRLAAAVTKLKRARPNIREEVEGYDFRDHFVEDIADMPRMILSAARAGDVVITMGAGSIGAVPGKLASIEEAV